VPFIPENCVFREVICDALEFVSAADVELDPNKFVIELNITYPSIPYFSHDFSRECFPTLYQSSPMVHLIYMARPIYGGWVTFTAHLSLKYSLPLYRIGSRTEEKQRDYGYGVQYQNRAPNDLPKGKLLITAIDKTYYEYLDKMPDGTLIVIHDPTEVSGKGKEPVLRNLARFKVITIRESVKKFLNDQFGIKSKFIVHPFYEYPFTKAKNPQAAVSISRIDFDKHTDIILKANKHLKQPIDIYGAINRQYVFFKLNDLGFKRFYKGPFDKSFEDLDDILADAKFVVDMSVIKNDGGGSQYTFLEAIYERCALVINSKWVAGAKTEFQDGKNCFMVADEEELAALLDRNPNTSRVLKGGKDLLQPHIEVNWPKEMARL
jgi:glycosyltransferase involved in cell wall biosynthesis